MSFSLCHGLRWMFPSYIIIYIPHSCWELEAVGVELPDETALEHHLRMKNRRTLLLGNRMSSILSLGETTSPSSQSSLKRKASSGKSSVLLVKKPMAQSKPGTVRSHTKPGSSQQEGSMRAQVKSAKTDRPDVRDETTAKEHQETHSSRSN